MYLKSIEVQGFKSFANKIKFDFHNGITGIVGPNGSGKSNVADAVRWVLGEQSAKQLRGANMQDVIFAGTQLRKPQSYASVAITLDNSDHSLNIDYDEVTITRKVYRSGESEYLMNGNQCRLRDITELFYDTGIGKEGYSIIGQGQIDKILSGKPEERRELFDEAAGIVKFKRRKTVTLKKLENERANMVRVTDILSELEKQVGPLERQSTAAKQYLEWKDELKENEINSFLLENSSLNQDLESLVEKKATVLNQQTQCETKKEVLHQTYSDVEDTLAALEESITEAREKIAEGNTSRSELEGRINVAREQINTEKMNEEHITNRVSVLTSQIQIKTSEKDDFMVQQQKSSNELYDAENAVNIATKDLEELELKIAYYRQNVEESRGKIIDILNEKTDIASRSQNCNTLLSQNKLHRAEQQRILMNSKGEEEKVKKELNQLEEEAAFVKSQLEEQQGKLAKAQAELQEHDTRHNEVMQKLNHFQQQFHVLESRADSVRNIAERYEGYGNAIKKIMEVKNQYPGIQGVVADLIHVEQKYETAVETALGGSIQNIVTDSEKTAKALIEYLKQNKYGRATFLPLDGIRNRQAGFESSVLNETGVIGAASDLVNADSKYKDVVSSLLGRTLVVDTIDHALSVAKKNRYSIRIVTLEGELLNAGGSMTGGAFRNSSNLLGRGRELETLEKEAQEARDEAERLSKELNQLKQLRQSDGMEIEGLQEEIQETSIQDTEYRMSMEAAKRKLEAVALAHNTCVKKLEEIEAEAEELKKEQEMIASTIKQLEEENSSSNNSVDEMNTMLTEAEKLQEEKQKHVEELRLSSVSLQQKSQFIAENISRIESELENLQQEKDGLAVNVGSASEAIEVKNQQIEDLRNQVNDTLEQIKTWEQALVELGSKKDAMAGTQKEFFEKRDELSNEMNDLEREKLRLESQIEKNEERLDTQTAYLWEEYEMTPSEAEGFRNPELGDATKLRKQIQTLRNQMKSLGNVNVNAIEEYKEISGRYEFMKGQHEDLLRAEASLVDIIAELDEGMRKQFNEKFEEIRVEFDRVFKELFGGGSGAIQLDEDADVIEAGITIISQPPGKKLQNMMQLSGGEKALTAIALLFAIQNLKPSPFCLLDEIEAALDDSNVGRFSGYLHKLTKHTQFIVITHRRGTMVAADRLYGITMQEKGVSTLVSVNLVEQELEN